MWEFEKTGVDFKMDAYIMKMYFFHTITQGQMNITAGFMKVLTPYLSYSTQVDGGTVFRELMVFHWDNQIVKSKWLLYTSL